MTTIEGLTARVTVSIQDARISIAGGQVDFDVPRIQVMIPREDCTELTRRMMPERMSFPAMEFGLGQRIKGQVSGLRGIELDYDGNEIHFRSQPKYRVELHQKLPVVGWKKIAAISGKVDVPGLIRFRLENPGAALSGDRHLLRDRSGRTEHPEHPRLGRIHLQTRRPDPPRQDPRSS